MEILQHSRFMVSQCLIKADNNTLHDSVSLSSSQLAPSLEGNRATQRENEQEIAGIYFDSSHIGG